jgi:A/G-specific adenine glycosylase
VSSIPDKIVAHFRATKRDLPWRQRSDAYAIWVSEIMLQQTRVQTVIPYYERWLERFPTVQALAEAPLDDVLELWSGLGYYSRARNLHRGAREVVATYEGALPGDAAGLRALPGIGRYTAGAIASMAYGERAAVVDGNVARVLARMFEVSEDAKSSAGQRKLWALAESLVPEDAPGDFNQGLMELGALTCTPTNPTCLLCPVREDCGAHANGTVDQYPVLPRRKRAADKPLLDRTAVWVERGARVLLARRIPSGLYGGLWELPQGDNADAETLSALAGVTIELRSEKPVHTHEQVLSHRRLRIRAHQGRTVGRLGKPDPGVYDRVSWHELEALDTLGVSSATRAIIDAYREQDGWQARPRSTTKRSRSSKRATERS